jgi:hypothetical protein
MIRIFCQIIDVGHCRKNGGRSNIFKVVRTAALREYLEHIKVDFVPKEQKPSALLV